MTALWGILIAAVSSGAGFYAGMRFVGVNLAKLLARLTMNQLAELADEVSKERERGHTG